MKFTIEFGGDTQDVTVTSSGVADLPRFRRCYNDRAVAIVAPQRDETALGPSVLLRPARQSLPCMRRYWVSAFPPFG